MPIGMRDRGVPAGELVSGLADVLGDGLGEAGADAAGLMGASPGAVMAASLGDLPRVLERLGVGRALVVVDRGAVAAAAVGDELEAALGGRAAAWFDGFRPNPRHTEAAAAGVAAARARAEGVVAVGGGSCLDVAKVGALCAGRPGEAESIAAGGWSDGVAGGFEPLPVIAVPTTSGTGSEATHFAAVYVGGRKVSVAHEGMRPRGVVLDERLHGAMPASVAASTGLDALCQAMESAWSVGSTGGSLRFALAGGRLVAGNLAESVSGGGAAARRGVMLGAHLVGRAIDVSKTTAAHALSYGLTEGYGLAHGHAVALTAGWVGGSNGLVSAGDCEDGRGAEDVRTRVGLAAGLLGVTPRELPVAVSRLVGSLGLAPSLREAGVPRGALAGLAAGVDPVRLGNNPRRLDGAGVLALLEAAWGGAG